MLRPRLKCRACRYEAARSLNRPQNLLALGVAALPRGLQFGFLRGLLLPEIVGLLQELAAQRVVLMVRVAVDGVRRRVDFPLDLRRHIPALDFLRGVKHGAAAAPRI